MRQVSGTGVQLSDKYRGRVCNCATRIGGGVQLSDKYRGRCATGCFLVNLRKLNVAVKETEQQPTGGWWNCVA